MTGLWSLVAMGGGAIVTALTLPTTNGWHAPLLWGGAGIALGGFLGAVALLACIPRETETEIGRDGPGATAAAPASPTRPTERPHAFMPSKPPGNMPLRDAISYMVERSVWGRREPRTEEDAFQEIKHHAYAAPGAGYEPSIGGYGAHYDPKAARSPLSSNTWRNIQLLRDEQGRPFGLTLGRGIDVYDVHLDRAEVTGQWPEPRDGIAF